MERKQKWLSWKNSHEIYIHTVKLNSLAHKQTNSHIEDTEIKNETQQITGKPKQIYKMIAFFGEIYLIDTFSCSLCDKRNSTYVINDSESQSIRAPY